MRTGSTPVGVDLGPARADFSQVRANFWPVKIDQEQRRLISAR